MFQVMLVTVFFLETQKSYLSRLTEIRQALKTSEFFKQHEVMTDLKLSDKLKEKRPNEALQQERHLKLYVLVFLV